MSEDGSGEADLSRGDFVSDEAGRRVANFGTLVRERRIAMRRTVSHLSETAGVTRRFIRELEAGKETVQLGRALLVAEAVGIDLVSAMRAFLQGPAPVAAEGFGDEDLPESNEPDDEAGAPGFGR